MISIVDNFLDQDEFDKLQTLMMGDSIAWLYLDGIDYKDEPGNVGKFQFYHTFLIMV